MRFIMATIILVLAVAFLPGQGFPATVYVRVKPPSASQQPNPKQPVKK